MVQLKKKLPPHRLARQSSLSVQNWRAPEGVMAGQIKKNYILDCGWGRLIFAHTFSSQKALAASLLKEKSGKRDIALYVRDPHVILSLAPQKLFLDPSHTYRLYLDQYRPSAQPHSQVVIRRVQTPQELEALNEILLRRHMIPVSLDFFGNKKMSRMLFYLIAKENASGHIIGAVLGVDHRLAFHDPENGCSLWSLAVDPQEATPGVGEALVRQVIEQFQTKGRSYLDVSVMHDNVHAIRLYEKLGFQRVPVFCIKKKNPFNERLFSGPEIQKKLNPYAAIIVNEARRRGIDVKILDAKRGYFNLSLGGRSITCRESLSELTSAVAMSRCDDKRVTRKLFKEAGLKVPAQQKSQSLKEDQAFLKQHGQIVVKPSRGEQGLGISVDVQTTEELKKARVQAKKVYPEVLLEAYVLGQDLRIIVIDYQVVAAALRRPPQIVGTGKHTVYELIQKQNRRRQAATGGESKIPWDIETRRCLQKQGFTKGSILDQNQVVTVRKTANLHTGGTIHDVTSELHSVLAEAAIKAAQAIQIPVVGLDLLVPKVDGPDYVLIEANERPGLANHEPQPTAERFIDLLFPESVHRMINP